MTIEIEWQTRPTPNNNEDKVHLLYLRMTDNGIVNFQTLCEMTAEYGSHSRGAVKGIANDLAEVLAKMK